MNGPTPIMFDMLSAVAWSRPKRRSSGAGVEAVGIWRAILSQRLCRNPSSAPCIQQRGW